MQSETKYSIFRRRQIGSRYIWHVHGEADKPETILLGHEQYAGQLQKLRTYATADRGSQRRPRSPFKVGALDFEGSGEQYSWIDVFFRDEIHILGLSLDYAEIDLWWLLAYKRRLHQMSGYEVGSTIFHQARPPATKHDACRLSILESFGVQVQRHSLDNGYSQVYDEVLDGLATHRSG